MQPELLQTLTQNFDASPVPVFASSLGRVVWKNRLADRVFPSLRRRMRLDRLSENFPASGGGACVTLFSEDYFLVCETVGGLSVYTAQRLTGAFREEFSVALLAYAKELNHLMREGVAATQAAPSAQQNRYLNALARHVRDAGRVQDLLESLSQVRPLHCEKVFAVSVGEMVEFFRDTLETELADCGLSLSATAESGLVALVNFRDFVFSLLHLVHFFSSFVLSDTLSLSVRRASEGECVLSLSGEDPYDLLQMYRVLRRGTANVDAHKSALFFPLFCAMNTFSFYRHRCCLSRVENRLVFEISLRTTTELPSLVVREGEEDAAASKALRAELSEAFWPAEVRRYLARRLSEDACLPEGYGTVRVPKLFS